MSNSNEEYTASIERELVSQENEYDPMGAENEFVGDGENGEGNEVNGSGEVAVNGVEHDQDMGDGQHRQTQQAVGIQGERQSNKVRITTPYLTKYERARVLGTRALQIR